MSLGSTDRSSLLWHLFLELAIVVFVGAIVGWFTSDLLFRWTRPSWAGAVFGALVSAHLGVLARSRHLLILLQLQTVAPWRSLRRSRVPALRAQTVLLEDHDRLRASLLRLLSAGQTEGNTYQDLMDLAHLLYSAHTVRFWATSLDRWSVFLGSNEPYVRQMLTECEEHAGLALFSHEGDRGSEVPGHARLFILQTAAFVEDVIHAPMAARILVKHHLRAWRAPLRLLIYQGESFSPLFRKHMESCDISGDFPEIPDFMLVDDLFVYGRAESDPIQPQPFETPMIKLAYSAEPEVVHGYERLFRHLWGESLDVREFCAALRLSMTKGTEYAATSPSIRLSVARTLQELGGFSASEREHLLKAFENIEEDVTDFLNSKEREVRYADIPSEAEGNRVEAVFRSYVERARGAILAIDQADIKRRPTRFWETWDEDTHYKQWNEATKHSGAATKQRIYVISKWEGLRSLSAGAFIASNLDEGIEVGLIHQEDLKRLAAGKFGRQEIRKPRTVDASRAGVDSDFIIAGLELGRGQWEVAASTRGFEVSYQKYPEGRVDYTSLLCRERIERLLRWYLEVMECEATYFIRSRRPGMDNFEDFLNRKLETLEQNSRITGGAKAVESGHVPGPAV